MFFLSAIDKNRVRILDLLGFFLRVCNSYEFYVSYANNERKKPMGYFYINSILARR